MSAQAVINKLASAATMLVVAKVLARDEIGLGNLVLGLGSFLVVLPPFVMCDVLVTRRISGGTEFARAKRFALLIGIGFTAALSLAAPLVANAFPDFPRSTLVALLVVIAMRTTTNALMAPPLAQLRSALQYRPLALVDGTIQLAATAATLVLALAGAGAFSIVAPQLGASAGKALIYRRAARRIPIAAEADAAQPARDGSTSRAFLIAALAQYAHTAVGALPLLFVGYLFDEDATGDYGFAFMLATQATVIIAFQLGTILQPVYSRLADDPQRQTLGYLRTVDSIGLVAVPLSLLQCALSEPLFNLLFAPKWNEALPLFQALSIAQAFHFALAPTLAMLKSRGMFTTILAWQFLQLVASGLAFGIVAAPHGPLGIAIADTVLWGLGILAASVVAAGGSGIGAGRVLRSLIRPWILATPIALAAWTAWWTLPAGTWSDLAAIVAIGPAALWVSVLLAARSSPDVANAVRRARAAVTQRLRGRGA
jgi:O-antigen/teichoic acid export membrane protein